VYARTLTGRGFRPLAVIQKAHFGNDAGLIGAADLARHSINEPPGMSRGFWPRRRTSVRTPRRTLRPSLSATLAGPVVRDK
ncbi:ROK family protein, partial [Clostridioides difficile]|nr:ROK family protein [Clostridioides difficile]